MQPQSESTTPTKVIVSVTSSLGAVLGALANGILFLTRLQEKLPSGFGYLLAGVSIGIGIGGLGIITLYIFSRQRRLPRNTLGWASGVMGFFSAVGVLSVIIQTMAPPATEEVLIHSDGGTYSDGSPVSVSDIKAFSEHNPPHVYDSITIEFVYKNETAQPIQFRSTHIAARNPERGHKDFGEGNYGQVLDPDRTLTIRGSMTLDEPGIWEFWPGYRIGETQYGPHEWHSFQVKVTGRSGASDESPTPVGAASETVHADLVVRLHEVGDTRQRPQEWRQELPS
jgi:hypothetical protein